MAGMIDNLASRIAYLASRISYFNGRIASMTGSRARLEPDFPAGTGTRIPVPVYRNRTSKKIIRFRDEQPESY